MNDHGNLKDALLSPHSVALIGQSNDPGKTAGRPLKFLRQAGYRGRIYPINARRDAGVHSLGEIWRRHRLSCATREQLGSYVLGVLLKEAADYLMELLK